MKAMPAPSLRAYQTRHAVITALASITALAASLLVAIAAQYISFIYAAKFVPSGAVLYSLIAASIVMLSIVRPILRRIDAALDGFRYAVPDPPSDGRQLLACSPIILVALVLN